MNVTMTFDLPHDEKKFRAAVDGERLANFVRSLANSIEQNLSPDYDWSDDAKTALSGVLSDIVDGLQNESLIWIFK